MALTPREFALLEYLMRRRRRGGAQDRDPAATSGTATTSGDPNVVEVYVGYLRRKIDVPFGRRSLETVRGVGYRLAADGG